MYLNRTGKAILTDILNIRFYGEILKIISLISFYHVYTNEKPLHSHNNNLEHVRCKLGVIAVRRCSCDLDLMLKREITHMVFSDGVKKKEYLPIVVIKLFCRFLKS